MKSSLIYTLFFCLALTAITTAGCSKKSAETDAPQQTDAAGEDEANPDEQAAVLTERIVSLNGPITEILVELGLQDRLVGVDASSTYPEALKDLPNVGYYRQLSDEGVLGLSPSLIIGGSDAGPDEVIQKLKKMDVPLVLLPMEDTEAGAIERIRAVAKAVQLNEKGEALAQKIQASLDKAKTAPGLPNDVTPPKILGIYARGAGLSLVAGKNTAFDAVIRMAGAENAIDGLDGYQPLTPEALAKAEADILLLPDGGFEALGGTDGVLNLRGVAQTAAGKNARILHYDDQLLLGLGPRLPEIITVLRHDIAEIMGVEAQEIPSPTDTPNP